jgi:hypothetical protein
MIFVTWFLKSNNVIDPGSPFPPPCTSEKFWVHTCRTVPVLESRGGEKNISEIKIKVG